MSCAIPVGAQVLEIGYGLGYSAAAIQNEGPPARHVIVDCEPAVVQEARRWAEGKPGVEIIEGSSYPTIQRRFIVLVRHVL